MNIKSCFCFLLIVISTSCGTVSTPEAVEPTSVNLLFILDGDVEIRRPAWKEFFQVSSGAILYPGDQLHPELGAHIVVLCNDLSTWAVPSGTISGVNNGCLSDEKTFLIRPTGNIGGTRAANNPFIPYVISPRSTKILDSRPSLRWNSVIGAQSYSVKLHSSDFDWQTETTSTHITYSGDLDLKPGIVYELIIETDTGQSSRDEGGVDLGFSLLPDGIAAQVKDDSNRINSTDLSDIDKQYAIAQLYASTGLIAESILKLEDLNTKSHSNPRIYNKIGDLYLRIGLPYLAEQSYIKGLEISQTVNDFEAIGMAQYGLGEVYAVIGNKYFALKWLHLAEKTYRSLGDINQEEVIREKEEILSNGG